MSSSDFTIVLASRSPQREAILRQLRVPFRICVSAYGEDDGDGAPAAAAEANAAGKTRDVLGCGGVADDELVLGVDTVVALDGVVYGKAAGVAAARSYLQALSGRTHHVYSGVCLSDGRRTETAHARTAVSFRILDEATIAAYLRTGEWRERAGAYAIQGVGSALVAAVDGDFWNVVGLPVPLVLELLAGFGVTPLSWI